MFLKNGAVFIADAHYVRSNELLYEVLEKFKNSPPPQLFLVGDMFHLLLNFSFLKSYNQKVIHLINEIAKKSEVYYFEGNHDFCLEGIFDKNVILLKELKRDGICINHGDLSLQNSFYKIYTKVIRNKIVLNFLHLITLNFVNNWLFKKILSKQIKCQKIENFEKLAQKKIEFHKECNLIIEGHYHQNKKFKNYLNLPSLFCQKSYLIYRQGEFREVKIKI